MNAYQNYTTELTDITETVRMITKTFTYINDRATMTIAEVTYRLKITIYWRGVVISV